MALLYGGGGRPSLEGRTEQVAVGAAHVIAHRVVPGGFAGAVAHHGTRLAHRQDASGLRVDGVHHSDHRVLGPDHRTDRVLDDVLLLRQDREVDLQCAAVERVQPILVARTECRHLIAQHHALGVVADEGIGRALAAVDGGLHLGWIESLGSSRLGHLQRHALVAHLGVQHCAAPSQCGLQIVHRVGRTWVLHQAGQHGRLGDVQLRGVDVEVVPGRGLHAVGAVAVVRHVQVALEDFVLGQVLLKRDRITHLEDLAIHGCGLHFLFAGLLAVAELDAHQLHILLGERRATTADSAAGRVAERRPDDRLHVDRTVFEEAVILDGDLGHLHLGGDLVERDVLPVLVVELRQQRAVGHVHAGRLVLRWHRKVGRHVL